MAKTKSAAKPVAKQAAKTVAKPSEKPQTGKVIDAHYVHFNFNANKTAWRKLAGVAEHVPDQDAATVLVAKLRYGSVKKEQL